MGRVITTNQMLSTSYPYPWCLIRWGGQVAGQRPRTKVAYITEAIAKDGVIREFRVWIEKGKGCFYKRASKVPAADVLVEFRHLNRFTRPTEAMVNTARIEMIDPQ